MYVKRLLLNRLRFSIINLTPPTEDTCRGAANSAWELLNNFGSKAYDEYWEKRIPPPIICEKSCKCGPENYLATFDWENETMMYEINGSESSVPGFFALSITLFSSFLVIADF